MSDNVLVKVDDLAKDYAGFHAVAGVSFVLERGEILGFLGPNGAGKSTTMGMLCGVIPPDRGYIEIDGVDLKKQPLVCKSKLGYLPEQPPLYHDATVDEYLGFCARLRGVSGRQSTAAVTRAKEQCGLCDVGKRLIGQLSKGFQQRTGIAQAIVHSPEIIILDEPTVGLDPLQIRQVRDLIKWLGRDFGVILSTHILPEARAVCDRVQLMSAGRMVFSETMSVVDADNDETPLVRVGLARPPAFCELERLACVLKIESVNPNTFEVEFQSQLERDQFVALAVQRDWGLRELSPIADPLEALFLRLTTDGALPSEPEDVL